MSGGAPYSIRIFLPGGDLDAFSSPSTAAGVLLSRPANGRVEWETRDGRLPRHGQEIVVSGL